MTAKTAGTATEISPDRMAVYRRWTAEKETA